MKKLVLTVAFALGLAGAAVADPLEGMWRTIPDDNGNSGLIRVAPCGTLLCGTLIKAYGPDGKEMASPNIGKQIISQTQAKGGGQYRGKVYSPDRDKTYNSRLQLTGNKLAVEGCVLGICRNGGNWARAN